MLPWNLSVASTPDVYTDSFGFRLGPLYPIGFASALAVALLRRRLDMARALVMVAVLVLLWFPLFQEPRFLLPAAGILALLSGWAFDQLLPSTRRLAAASALWSRRASSIGHSHKPPMAKPPIITTIKPTLPSNGMRNGRCSAT